MVATMLEGQTSVMQLLDGEHGSTVTVKLQVALLPRASNAVLCTTLLPKGNRLHEGGTETTV